MYVKLLFVCFVDETNVAFATVIRLDVDIFPYVFTPVLRWSGESFSNSSLHILVKHLSDIFNKYL